jgi:conjugative relaxase-like TrwC/TraI family protein
VLNIPKPLSAGKAQTYHKLEFTSEASNYYKQGDTVQGEWQGQLAAKMGLSGTVTAEEFARLTEGRHPQTDEQMVKHREGKEYKNADGSITKPVEHRAGWDATFSAPKSVSLTALVGGDDRVRQAHGEAVTVALTELEQYTQARIGGNNPAETTGKFVAAKFEHDTARPADGYAAPQLHTHVVIFNVTEREDGSTRALQSLSFFETQNYATAVYQSVLTYKLRDLGYEIEAGRSGAPEIKGYSQEYLDASSPRNQLIRENLAKSGHSGAEAAQIAALATRDKKQILAPEQVLAAHREIAESFGNEAATVVAEARTRAERQERKPDGLVTKAKEAVTYARSSNFEREAVVDERMLMRDALRHGMGETTFDQVRAEFDARHKQGDFQQLKGGKHDSGRSFTTPETIANERANVAHVISGQQAVEPMMSEDRAVAHSSKMTSFNSAQRTVIQEVLSSPDRIHGLQGLAGTGKTTVLQSIRDGAEKSGYAVEGFAPTSRAAGQLRDAGISATTLQSFLARGSQGQTAGDPASRHLYLLDESSLTSTTQMRSFLEKIQPQDRVLLIGDTRQHQGVDAGRPFQQMQEAKMRTSQLDQIVRQRNNPELLEAVQLLATGKTVEGVQMLRDQGRVSEVKDAKERINAIANDYVAKPEHTIIVSPDNRSRQLINQAIRVELHHNGTLASDDREFRTLSQRSDMTGADREWAARYQLGDIIEYNTGSKALQLKRGATATVISADGRSNTLTVMREDGQTVTYDPTRLKGVNVYREVTREFATGDRIQFTANNKDLGISNRDLATIQNLQDGQITVRMDGKEARTVSFDPTQVRTFDHGYAVTSHSSQGLTERRVIANIDTDSSRTLINTRLAYVAVSRASDDVRIYTNDAETLGSRLANEVNKTAALDFTPAKQQAASASSAPTINQYANRDHRLAAVAQAYAERPESTVVVAHDPAERGELNRLIRSDLQRQGQVSPDSSSVTVFVEQPVSNRKLASQYTPGDLIQYRHGSPKIDGIPHNSIATVLSVDARTNSLTVQTASGDESTYSPHLSKTMTAESVVYRQEQREIAAGDRIQFTRADSDRNIRKGELGIITGINDAKALDIRLDTGSVVQLGGDQTRNLDHGYAVDRIKVGSPERILFTQDQTANEREIASLSRNGREVNIYTSDGSTTHNQEQSQPVQNQMTQSPTGLPQQPQLDSPAVANIQQPAPTVANIPQPTTPAIRIRMGR